MFCQTEVQDLNRGSPDQILFWYTHTFFKLTLLRQSFRFRAHSAEEDPSVPNATDFKPTGGASKRRGPTTMRYKARYVLLNYNLIWALILSPFCFLTAKRRRRKKRNKKLTRGLEWVLVGSPRPIGWAPNSKKWYEQ